MPAAEESVTVAVQVLDWPIDMVPGVHSTLVVVVRRVTVTLAGVAELLLVL